MFGKEKFFFLLTAVVFLFLPKSVLATSVGDVVINEVMWMGTQASANDEWIELLNTTIQEIDLSDWSLVAVDGTPTINLLGTILPSAYFLLERSNEETVSNILADQVYTGALGNNGEHLLLQDSQGKKIDEIDASFGWPAGKNILRISMERQDEEWATNNGVIINGKDANSNLIMGTPKNINSCFFLTPIPSLTLTPTSLPTGTEIPTLKPTLTLTPVFTPTPAPISTPTSTPVPMSTPTPTFIPTPTSAKATYQINEVKNKDGDILSSVKVYVDDQYVHHYAPEVLKFCEDCYCDDNKEVECNLGSHTMRLEKSGYQDWSVVEEIKAGDDDEINPVLIAEITPTIVSTVITNILTDSGNKSAIVASIASSGAGLADQLFFKSFKSKTGLVLGKAMDFSQPLTPMPVAQEEKSPSDFSHRSIFSDWIFWLAGSGYCFLGVGMKLFRAGLFHA